MDKINNPIRVSISEAAKLFGVDPHTIRRAIKREELLYIVVQGRYKINFESLVKWSQNRTTVKNKMEQNGIGQYVDKWKISNKKFSPNPERNADRETRDANRKSQNANQPPRT